MINERPVFFAAGSEVLLGVVAEPPPPIPDTAVVVLAEAIPGGIRGQDAILVRMARAIADAGWPSFRFDYHGIGESSGEPPEMGRDEPFLADVDGALAWLRDEGYRRFVLVGSCFGAQTSLVASVGNDDVVAVGMLSSILSATDDPAATSSLVVGAAEAAMARGVPLLFCYGREDDVFPEFAMAQAHRLRRCCEHETTTVMLLDGKIHSFVDVDAQGQAIAAVLSWLRGLTLAGWRDDSRPARTPTAGRPPS